MMWPFKRKPVPTPPLVDEQSWKIGDIAGCVEAGWKLRGMPAEGPEIGSQSLVIGIYEGVCNGYPAFGLTLAGWPIGSYRSDHFRKVILGETGADRKVTQRKPLRLSAPSGER
jgi:hypothetical protein